MINGLSIVKDFISVDEENKLLSIVKNLEWNGTLLRKSKHFGYNYNYKTKTITREDYLGSLPDWIEPYIKKMIIKGLIHKDPNQITVNRYLPGEGISPHIDVTSIFDNQLYSISLGSGCNMNFKKDDEYHSYYLPSRAFMLMENDARYKYKHSIKRDTCDIVDNKTVYRETRYSITFRNVIL
tara:strand:+ start:125 stop:670 length:546 start_codon:yes stop_codon:yes gene_type:complete